MAILFSNEIMDAVVKELHKAIDSVQIITAYCKEKTLKYLDSQINTEVKEKKLLVRFRLDDICSGFLISLNLRMISSLRKSRSYICQSPILRECS